METSEVSITYLPEVLEQIRFAALEAFHNVPHGGLEIGGMLYGIRAEGSLEIRAARELACEHLFGPAFILSDGDRSRIAELRSLPQRDPLLKGLAPLGWYRSASRRAAMLTSEDLDLHGELFPDGNSVILILKPARARPVRAQFYYRSRAGAWESLEEFELQPAGRAGRAAESRAPELEPAPPEQPAPPPTPAVAQPGPIPTEERAVTSEQARPEAPVPLPDFLQQGRLDTERAPSFSRPRWIWLVLAWLLAAVSAGFAVRDYWLPRPAAPLQVGLYDLDGQLTIGWERSAGPLREAQGGVLEILDGNQKNTVELTSELIQKGTAIYQRQSGDVVVRLRARLPGDKTLEGMARFSGPSPPRVGTDIEEIPQVQELRAELEQQAARIKELEGLNAALQKKLAKAKR